MSYNHEDYYQLCKSCLMDGNKNKRTVLKYLGLTKGWSMHDLVQVREEIIKYHPSWFWKKKDKLTKL